MRNVLLSFACIVSLSNLYGAETDVLSQSFENLNLLRGASKTPPAYLPKEQGLSFLSDNFPLSRSCDVILSKKNNIRDGLINIANLFKGLAYVQSTLLVAPGKTFPLECDLRKQIFFIIEHHHFTRKELNKALSIAIQEQSLCNEPMLRTVYFWMIHALLECGADANTAISSSDHTKRPLHCVRHPETARLLLVYGAEIEIADYKQLTQATKNICLFYLINLQNENPSNDEKHFTVINQLIQAGADVTADSSLFQGLWLQGLYRILSECHINFEKFKDKIKSASLTCQDIINLTNTSNNEITLLAREALLFYFIARCNLPHSDINQSLLQIELLLSQKLLINPNAPNPFFPHSWLQPLHCTVNTVVAELLIKHGANLNSRQSLSFIEYHHNRGHNDMVTYLKAVSTHHIPLILPLTSATPSFYFPPLEQWEYDGT